MDSQATTIAFALTEQDRDRSMLAHTSQLTDLLEQSELFRTLGATERAFLADRLHRRIFKRGEILITQGVPVEKIFLLGSGLVSILREDVSGVPTEAAQLGKGAIVGEMSMLTGSPPSATVVAMMDTEVWILDHDDFELLLSQSIPLALSVNRALSAKLAATTQRLVPQRTAQLTAFFGDRREAETGRLSLELAASLARHTRERVLLVDCFPLDRSALSGEQPWGESVEELLQDPTRFAKHTAPPNYRRAHGGARLIRYSNDPNTVAEPGMLLSFATRLRSLYSQIVFDLPHDSYALLSDMLPLMDQVVVVTHRKHLPELDKLLNMREVAGVKEKSLLAVQGWPHRPNMGEVWGVEERHQWKVAALIQSSAPQDGVDRLARTVAKLRVGIAWGSGSARGWALAGIASALEQLGVPMDLFAGTSAGAVGAAVYGLSLKYEIAEKRMLSILPYLKRTTRPFLPITLSRHSLLSETWWNNLIRTFVGEQTFEDMLIPHAAVALDLATGNQHVFKRGLLWPALRASSTIPFLAPPITIDGRTYADGGVVNAVPLDVVREMGADILVGIDLSGSDQASNWGDSSKPHMLGTFLRIFNVANTTAASRTIPLADVLIRPSLRPGAVYDPSVMEQFIEEGTRSTFAALPELRRAMPWLEP